jgi:hypothetical protein
VTGASAILALGAIVSVVAGQLASPPERVVFRTETFGDVVLPHAEHLAHRVTCRNCHGDGRITKVERFGKERGHQTCRGCHTELDRGPLKCLGCHVKRRGGGAVDPASASTAAR